MKKLLLLLLLATPAQAQQQQQPDTATLQKAITALQQQRNQAWDAAAAAQIEVQKLSEELAKLKAEIEKKEPPK